MRLEQSQCKGKATNVVAFILIPTRDATLIGITSSQGSIAFTLAMGTPLVPGAKVFLDCWEGAQNATWKARFSSLAAEDARPLLWLWVSVGGSSPVSRTKAFLAANRQNCPFKAQLFPATDQDSKALVLELEGISSQHQSRFSGPQNVNISSATCWKRLI